MGQGPEKQENKEKRGETQAKSLKDQLRKEYAEPNRTHNSTRHRPGSLQEGQALMLGKTKQNKTGHHRRNEKSQGKIQSSGSSESAKSEFKYEKFGNQTKQSNDKSPKI